MFRNSKFLNWYIIILHGGRSLRYLSLLYNTIGGLSKLLRFLGQVDAGSRLLDDLTASMHSSLF